MAVNQLYVTGMLCAHDQFSLYLLNINEYFEYNKGHSLLLVVDLMGVNGLHGALLILTKN